MLICVNPRNLRSPLPLLRQPLFYQHGIIGFIGTDFKSRVFGRKNRLKLQRFLQLLFVVPVFFLVQILRRTKKQCRITSAKQNNHFNDYVIHFFEKTPPGRLIPPSVDSFINQHQHRKDKSHIQDDLNPVF